MDALLERYQRAMERFCADDLADLYADDAVHEFGFFTPGHQASYHGRDEVRAAYRAAWATPAVDHLAVRNLAVHRTRDAHTLVAEWQASARQRVDDGEVSLAGVLVLTEEQGQLQHVRDYMDVLALALQTGRLRTLAERLDVDGPRDRQH